MRCTLRIKSNLERARKMKVLLVKDVYKLGRAGDVKKVADGFGRNFLLPQGMAVLATPGALKQSDKIRQKASIERAELNNELGGLSEQIKGLVFGFPGKAGETGKLYGSITTQMVADALNEKLGITKINRHQIEVEPIRSLGEFTASVRLTMDLNPEIKVVVYREGEVPATLQKDAKSVEPVAAVVEENAPVAEVVEETTPVDEVVEPAVEAVEEIVTEEVETEVTPDSDDVQE